MKNSEEQENLLETSTWCDSPTKQSAAMSVESGAFLEEEIQQERAEFATKAANLESRCSSLQESLNIMRERQASMRKAQKEMEEVRGREDQEIVSTMRMMKDYIDKLESENDYLAEACKHHKSQLEEKSKQNGDDDKENATNQAASDSDEKTNISGKEKIEKTSPKKPVVSKNTALIARLAEVRNENAALKDVIVFQNKQLGITKMENERLKSRIAELQEEQERLTIKCESLRDATVTLATDTIEVHKIEKAEDLQSSQPESVASSVHEESSIKPEINHQEEQAVRHECLEGKVKEPTSDPNSNYLLCESDQRFSTAGHSSDNDLTPFDESDPEHSNSNAEDAVDITAMDTPSGRAAKSDTLQMLEDMKKENNGDEEEISTTTTQADQAATVEEPEKSSKSAEKEEGKTKKAGNVEQIIVETVEEDSDDEEDKMDKPLKPVLSQENFIEELFGGSEQLELTDAVNDQEDESDVAKIVSNGETKIEPKESDSQSGDQNNDNDLEESTDGLGPLRQNPFDILGKSETSLVEIDQDSSPIPSAMQSNLEEMKNYIEGLALIQSRPRLSTTESTASNTTTKAQTLDEKASGCPETSDARLEILHTMGKQGRWRDKLFRRSTRLDEKTEQLNEAMQEALPQTGNEDGVWC